MKDRQIKWGIDILPEDLGLKVLPLHGLRTFFIKDIEYRAVLINPCHTSPEITVLRL